MSTKINALITVLMLGFAAPASALVLDFDFDAQGNPINPGQVIDNEYALWGVDISVNNLGGGPNIGVAFDSNNPTGDDFDLRTPNPFLHPTNTVDYNNLLIIQETGFAGGDGNLFPLFEPDDEGGGGIITFLFDDDQIFAETVIVDIEETGGTLDFYNDNVFIGSVNIAAIGNGSVQTLTFDGGAYDEMRVNLAGSGAVAQVLTTAIPEPSTYLLLGTTLGVALFLQRRRSRA